MRRSDPHVPELLDSVSTVELVPGEAGEKIYFVSDMHMGDGSFADIFQGKDESFLAFLDEVEAEASTLVINGDALDYSEAWYFERILKAHRPLLKRLTRLAERMAVVYCYGNHDTNIVLFEDILKWKVCQKLMIGDRVLVQHGVEYDPYISARFTQSDHIVKMLNLYERLFKTWIRVPLSDYYTVSNRMAHYLFFYLVKLQRQRVRLLRWRGQVARARKIEDAISFWTQTELGDPMTITRPVLDRLRTDRFELIVCGHSHLPGVVEVEGGRKYVNLGSWTFGNAQYGVWDGQNFILRDWRTGRVFGDENYAPIFSGSTDLTYEEWFHSQYMGYLRFRCGEDSFRSGVRPPPHLRGPGGVLPDTTHQLPDPMSLARPDGRSRP
jgi:UDP-2,3-diacylglucosamine hydrolase